MVTKILHDINIYIDSSSLWRLIWDCVKEVISRRVVCVVRVVENEKTLKKIDETRWMFMRRKNNEST